ncbi:MAG: TetR/AcrR family transcriptional regulator [Lachnospiraceae bacterium]
MSQMWMEKKEEKEKVQALYGAVEELLAQGADLSRLKVEDITKKAGIGKGTAYEYFSSKEEIIVSAIIHLSQSLCRDLLLEIEKYPGFKEKIYAGFARLEEGPTRSECFLRILSILLGSDSLSNQLRKEVEEKKKNMPLFMVSYLAECGQKEGVIRKDLPHSYVVSVLASKALIYLAYRSCPERMKECKPEEMKALIYEGLMRELSP